MKRLLPTLFLTAALAACEKNSDTSGKPSGQASAVQEKHEISKEYPQLDEKNITGFDEKVDSQKIGMSLKQAGADTWQNKEAEWNRKLASAQTNHDFQAVISDQLTHYRKVSQAISGLEMKSTKGKEIHAKLNSGINGTISILQALQTLDVATAKGQVKMNGLTPEINRHARNTMQAMQAWVSMMKTHHRIDQDAEAKFNQKMKELDEKTK